MRLAFTKRDTNYTPNNPTYLIEQNRNKIQSNTNRLIGFDNRTKSNIYFPFFFLIYLFQAQQITTHYLTYTTYEVILILFTIRE